MSMTKLLVKAFLEGSVFSGEQISAVLPLEPGLYSDQTELLLSSLHPSAELTIYGPPVALSNLEVGQGVFTLIQNEIVGDDYVREGKQRAVKCIRRQEESVSTKDLKLNTDVLSGLAACSV